MAVCFRRLCGFPPFLLVSWLTSRAHGATVSRGKEGGLARLILLQCQRRSKSPRLVPAIRGELWLCEYQAALMGPLTTSGLFLAGSLAQRSAHAHAWRTRWTCIVGGNFSPVKVVSAPSGMPTCAPSRLRSLPSVAFETVPLLVWLTVPLFRPFRKDWCCGAWCPQMSGWVGWLLLGVGDYCVEWGDCSFERVTVDILGTKERSSSAFSYYASLLHAFDGVVSLILCPLVLSQAPQHMRCEVGWWAL